MMSLDRKLFASLLFALLVPWVLWFGTMFSMSAQLTTGGIDRAAGRELFRDRCGACHFLDQGVSTHHGPSLHEIGRIASTRKPGVSTAAYLLESILAPDAYVAPNNWQGMPRNVADDLSAGQIRNIIAFLASRGGTPDYHEIRQLDIPDEPAAPPSERTIRRDQMELAERVLLQKGDCLQCHSPFRNAEYRWRAPSLFGLGLSEADVRQSILEPNQVVPPSYRDFMITLVDGRTVRGQLISRNEEEVVVLARDAHQGVIRRTIPIAEIETEEGKLLMEQTNLSRMPTGFGELLSAEELNAVVNLIQQLN